MSLVGQFILNNLLPAFLSGLLAWLMISASLALLRIEYSPLRLSLLYAPVVKASLVMLGIGLALPWPRQFFAAWHARALSTTSLIPLFLIWSGIVLALNTALAWRARQLAVQNSIPAEQAAPRLVNALDQVMAGYQAGNTTCRVGTPWVNCCLDRSLSRPSLLASNRVASPYIVTDKVKPVLVFPTDLANQLTDDELPAALAHEIAHLTLDQPTWCSSVTVRRLVGLAPFAGLLAAQLRHEEEKACDDMAITILGHPEVFANMLLKSYRFACQQAHPLMQSIQGVQPLLGLKPKFSERIERLVRANHLQQQLWLQQCAACVIWIGVLLFF